MVNPYRDGCKLYLDAGWTGVLPLPPGKKSPPPPGFTGWNGNDPITRLFDSWCGKTTGDYQAASNIAIHMPDGVIGIDVDHYDDKTGGDTLAALEAELGPLPYTYVSTSRAVKPSGIRWFRVEPGLRWPTGPGKDIEFIHSGHRYAVVWPSIHPSGAKYIWVNRAGMIDTGPPTSDELSWLPDEWQIRFTGGEQRTKQPEYRAPTDQERSHCLTDGSPCYAVTKMLNSWVERTTVKARHDAMLELTMSLVRLGEQGHQGVMAAVVEFRDTFTKQVRADRKDGSEESEYTRAINGAIAKVSQAPTAHSDRGCCGDSRRASDTGRRKTLPASFWDARPILKHIQQAAHSRGRCPDVALYSALARVSSMVSPRLQFESCLGSCSTNLFVVAADRSGGGKSTGYKVGKELTPVPPSLGGDRFRDGMGLGSGEGLAEIYMGMETQDTGDVYASGPRKGQPRTKEVRAKIRDNAFLHLDEGQALMEQAKRQGNTTFPTLRSAWDGATLGQANGRADTTRHIPEGSYSMGLAIGFQEDTCQDLLADSTAGTPQRFIWCWATDPEIPDERPEWPGSLPINLHNGYLDIKDDGGRFMNPGGRRIRFAQEINDELWREDLAKNRGEIEVPRLDSQKPKMLCKLSALLCAIDGRSVVTLEDWDLAKTMYATSSAVVEHLVECGREMAESKAEASAERHVVREARGHYAKTVVVDNIHRIAVLTYKHAVDKGVLTPGAHRKLHSGRDKPYFSEALDYAVKQKWLSLDSGKVATHISTPPNE